MVNPKMITIPSFKISRSCQYNSVALGHADFRLESCGNLLRYLILNKKNNQWGSQDYLASDDVLRITCTPRQAEKRERLAFYFEDIDPDAFSASVVLHWDTVTVSFKIEEP